MAKQTTSAVMDRFKELRWDEVNYINLPTLATIAPASGGCVIGSPPHQANRFRGGAEQMGSRKVPIGFVHGLRIGGLHWEPELEQCWVTRQSGWLPRVSQ
jgi:hypothetical protein